MCVSLRALLCYNIFIYGTYGIRRIAEVQEPGLVTVDVTQLFAGLDHIEGQGKSTGFMCCCRSKCGSCKIVEWIDGGSHCKNAIDEGRKLGNSFHKHSSSHRPADGRVCLVDKKDLAKDRTADFILQRSNVKFDTRGRIFLNAVAEESKGRTSTVEFILQHKRKLQAMAAIKRLKKAAKESNGRTLNPKMARDDSACAPSSPTSRNVTIQPSGVVNEPTPTVKTLTVYLLRHGQSTWNVFTETKFKNGKRKALMGEYKDAQLTSTGVDQAISSQEYFRETLADVEPRFVQVAGSLLIRAYDTVVAATFPLWSSDSWKAKGYEYFFDQVPAFMEFGGQDTERISGSLDYSPVRLSRSALPEHGVIPAGMGESFEQHYDDDDPNAWLTKRPWKVQTKYPRFGTWRKCNKNKAQLDKAISYMVDVANSGKRHLIVGTHSNFIRCLMQHAAGTGIVEKKIVEKKKLGVTFKETRVEATWAGTKKTTYNVHEKKIANGGVLSFDLKVEPSAAKVTFEKLRVQTPRRGYPYRGKLTVQVLQGNRLVAMDKLGKSDPYVRISFGDYKGKSKTVWNTLNPKWGFLQEFPLASFMQVVRLQIWDKDIGVGGDDFMGDLTIPIDYLEKKQGQHVQMTLPVANVPGGKEGGSVVLKVMFSLAGMIRRRSGRKNLFRK